MPHEPRLFRFSFGRKNFTYLNDDLPPTMIPKYADWRVEDAQIKSLFVE